MRRHTRAERRRPPDRSPGQACRMSGSRPRRRPRARCHDVHSCPDRSRARGPPGIRRIPQREPGTRRIAPARRPTACPAPAFIGHRRPPEVIRGSVRGQGAGGATGVRTPDLLNAIQTLFQLSYSPIRSEAEYSRGAEARQGPRGRVAAVLARAPSAPRAWIDQWARRPWIDQWARRPGLEAWTGVDPVPILRQFSCCGACN